MQIHDYHDPPHPHSSQQIEKMSAPPKTATKPKATQSIGHYDLEKNIGEGNFAKVRLAKHTITGQQVRL